MSDTCTLCGKPKKIHARGMCYTCYHREYQRKYYSNPEKRQRKRLRDREYHRKRKESKNSTSNGEGKDMKNTKLTGNTDKRSRNGLKKAEERILRFMSVSDREEFTPAEIQQGTDLDINTVRYLLRKMKASGKLLSPRWGVYSLAYTEEKNVPEAVVEFLGRNEGEFSPAEIAYEIGVPINRLRPALVRLKKEGKIISPRWGYYTGRKGSGVVIKEAVKREHKDAPKTGSAKGKKRSVVDDAVIEFLSSHNGDFSPAEIADGTGIAINRLRPVLLRLKKEGKVISPKWGRYTVEATAVEAVPAKDENEEGEKEETKPGGCVFFPGYRDPVYDSKGNIVGCIMGGKKKTCKDCPDNPNKSE